MNAPSSAASRSRSKSNRSKLLGIDLSSFPSVDEAQIGDASVKRRYRLCCNAINALHGGHSMRDAAQIGKTSERNLRRLVSRFLSTAADGRPEGYRALLRGRRLHCPVRTAPLREFPGSPHAGFGGIFTKLLADHDSVRIGLVMTLGQKGPGAYKPNTVKGRDLHKEFLRLCKDAGIGCDDYPFNTQEKARRSLHQWVRREYLPRYAEAYVKAQSGQDAATAFEFQRDGDARRTPAKVWEEWQIDEVTIDVQAMYEVLGPDLIPFRIKLPRVPVIVCKDSGGKSIPAWKLVVAKAVTADDLLDLMWSAISGPRKIRPVVESLDYGDGAGFPTTVLPEMKYALPRVVKFDNALAHLADAVRNAIENVCGCDVDFGHSANPLERAEIESEIFAIAKKYIHQLPGTTGSHPKDPLRKKASRAVDKLAHVDAIEHALDVFLANRNSEAREASNFTAPLERLRYAVAHKLIDARILPPDKRHAHFFGTARVVSVRMDLKKGRKPFVNFLGKRYLGLALRPFMGVLNKKLLARSNPRDLRTIVVFDEDGRELGTLRAEGQWGVLPHDMRIRKLFMRLRGKKALSEQAEDKPLHYLYKHLNEGAAVDTNSAAQLAYVIRYLQGHIGDLDLTSRQDLADARALEDAMERISVVALPHGSPSQEIPPTEAPTALSFPSPVAPSEERKPQSKVYVLPRRAIGR